MTDTKFTPGPWEWHGKDLESTTDLSHDVIETEVFCSPYCYGGMVEMTISDADRALIAAAPDLYEALADIVRDFEGHPGFGPARKALAKAEGKS